MSTHPINDLLMLKEKVAALEAWRASTEAGSRFFFAV
jgi:hypothetical protein